MLSANAQLVDLIAAIVEAESDIKTVLAWARLVGVSEGALRGYCGTAGVRAKAALDLGRLLRVVTRSRKGLWEPAAWLDVSDPRHLRRLLKRGGVDGCVSCPTVAHLLRTQALVPRAGRLIELLAIHVSQACEPEDRPEDQRNKQRNGPSNSSL